MNSMQSEGDYPADASRVDALIQRSRQLVRRRALVAAGVAVLPIPGVDWLTDVAILIRLLPQISQMFGLSAEQVERLAPDRRLVVYKAISAGSGMLVGRIVTRELVLQMLSWVGVRLSAQQAAKFVPIAGQAVSALLTYSSLKFVCEQHIQQCAAVARQLLLPPPVQSSANP